MRLIATALLCLHFSLHAQTPQDQENKPLAYKAQLHAGRMLPFGIYGARDIYPFWGLRLGHPWGDQDVEWATAFIRSRNVVLYNGSVSLAFPSELEGFK